MRTVCKYCGQPWSRDQCDGYEVDLSEFLSYWGLRPSQARRLLRENPGMSLGEAWDKSRGYDAVPATISVTVTR